MLFFNGMRMINEWIIFLFLENYSFNSIATVQGITKINLLCYLQSINIFMIHTLQKELNVKKDLNVSIDRTFLYLENVIAAAF